MAMAPKVLNGPALSGAWRVSREGFQQRYGGCMRGRLGNPREDNGGKKFSAGLGCIFGPTSNAALAPHEEATIAKEALFESGQLKALHHEVAGQCLGNEVLVEFSKERDDLISKLEAPAFAIVAKALRRAHGTGYAFAPRLVAKDLSHRGIASVLSAHETALVGAERAGELRLNAAAVVCEAPEHLDGGGPCGVGCARGEREGSQGTRCLGASFAAQNRQHNMGKFLEPVQQSTFVIKLW